MPSTNNTKIMNKESQLNKFSTQVFITFDLVKVPSHLASQSTNLIAKELLGGFTGQTVTEALHTNAQMPASAYRSQPFGA